MKHHSTICTCLLLLAFTVSSGAEPSQRKTVLAGAGALLLLATTGYTFYAAQVSQAPQNPRMGKEKISPLLTYKVQNKLETGEWVFSPKVLRENASVLDDSSDSQMLRFHICSPIKKVDTLRDYTDRVFLLCEKWFEDNKMILPHQVLKISAKLLNFLLLPELVYSVQRDTLNLKAALIQLTLPNGDADYKVIIDHQTAFYRRWPMIPKIIVGNDRHRVENINDSFRLRQHYPVDITSLPQGSPHTATFRFSIPGIAHLHSDQKEFYLVTVSRREGFVWRINAPWPDGLTSMYFW